MDTQAVLAQLDLSDEAVRNEVFGALVDAGLDFGTCTRVFGKRDESELQDAYYEAARDKESPGEIEVDDNAIISKGDEPPGAYVMAWVWVSDNDAGIAEDDDGEDDDIHTIDGPSMVV